MGALCSRRDPHSINLAADHASQATGTKDCAQVATCGADRTAAERDGGTGGVGNGTINGKPQNQPSQGSGTGEEADHSVALCSSGSEAFDECVKTASKIRTQHEEGINRMAGIVKDVFGPDVKLVNVTAMGSCRIFVLDGVIPEHVREQLFGCLEGDVFCRTEFARPETRGFRHNVVEYNPTKLKHTELHLAIDHLVQTLFPVGSAVSEPLEVYRIYTNAVMFTDVAFTHRDSNDADHVTAIVYPNPEWAPEFGGETMFYDGSGEIIAAVEPRPGRVVLFNGNIYHKGSPPSRLFWGSRYTTAFKFAPVERACQKQCQSSVPTGDNDRPM